MSVNQYAERLYWVQEARQDQPSVVKLIITFIIGFLVMSPAILGIYWEWILTRLG